MDIDADESLTPIFLKQEALLSSAAPFISAAATTLLYIPQYDELSLSWKLVCKVVFNHALTHMAYWQQLVTFKNTNLFRHIQSLDFFLLLFGLLTTSHQAPVTKPHCHLEAPAKARAYYSVNMREDPEAGAVYCEYCEMWLSSPRQWEKHKIGSKHWKHLCKCVSRVSSKLPVKLSVQCIHHAA